MNKYISISIVAFIAAIILLGGCSQSIVTTNTTNDTPTSTAEIFDIKTVIFSDKIQQSNIHVTDLSITVTFKTSFPAGTIFNSQLYENNLALAWWPSSQDFPAQSGEIEIKVILKEVSGSINRCSAYYCKIWAKDDPSIMSGTFFDEVGPPAYFFSQTQDKLINIIDINGISTNYCDSTNFFGLTSLSNGTVLRSQLYLGEEPVSWWPANRDIVVVKGKWYIYPLDDLTGPHSSYFQKAHYTFTIWEKDNPQVATTVYFDVNYVP